MTFPFLLTGTKLGNTGSSKLIAIQSVKTIHVWTGIIKLVTKYFFEKKVSSANQKVNTTMILGLYLQFIQMVQSGFNAEPNQND